MAGIVGLLTNEGSAKIQAALGNVGWYIYPKSFLVTDAAPGTFDAARVGAFPWEALASKSIGDEIWPVPGNGFYYVADTAGTTGASQPSFPTVIGNTVMDGGVRWRCVGTTSGGMAAAWYSAPISSVVVQPPNQIQYILQIPPGVVGVNKNITEIYVLAQDQSGNTFMLLLAVPQTSITYNIDGTTTLRLTVTLANVNVGTFVFNYTQATEISAHNTDPNAHGNIQAMVKNKENLLQNTNMEINRYAAGSSLTDGNYHFGPATYDGKLTATTITAGTLIQSTSSIVSKRKTSMLFQSISMTGGATEVHVRLRIPSVNSKVLNNGRNVTSRLNTTGYSLGNCIVPNPGNGFYYVCTAAGTSGGSPPTFPTVLGNTVADGTVTWMCLGATTKASLQFKVLQDTGNTVYAVNHWRTPTSGVDDFAGTVNEFWVSPGATYAILTGAVTTIQEQAVDIGSLAPNGDLDNGLEIEIVIAVGTVVSKNVEISELKLELGNFCSQYEPRQFNIGDFLVASAQYQYMKSSVIVGTTFQMNARYATHDMAALQADLAAGLIPAGSRVLFLPGNTYTQTADIASAVNNLYFEMVDASASINQNSHSFTLSGTNCTLRVRFTGTGAGTIVLSGSGTYGYGFDTPLAAYTVSNGAWVQTGGTAGGTTTPGGLNVPGLLSVTGARTGTSQIGESVAASYTNAATAAMIGEDVSLTIPSGSNPTVEAAYLATVTDQSAADSGPSGFLSVMGIDHSGSKNGNLVGFDTGWALTSGTITGYLAGYRATDQTLIGGGATIPSYYGFYSALNAEIGKTKYAFYAAGTAPSFFVGAVGIGGAPAANTGLTVSGFNAIGVNVVEAAPATGFLAFQWATTLTSVPVSGTLYGVSIDPINASGSTLSNLYGFWAGGSVSGSGSIITNYFGHYVADAFVGTSGSITNYYGFYSNISSGSNKWAFYGAGTAPSLFNGQVTFNAAIAAAIGIGTAPVAGVGLTISGFTGLGVNIIEAAPINGFLGVQWSTTLTSVPAGGTLYGVSIDPINAAGATLTNLVGFFSGGSVSGNSSIITNYYGFYAADAFIGTGGAITNYYGFYSNISAAANRYAFYAAGTAASFFGGPVTFNGAITYNSSFTFAGRTIYTSSISITPTVLSGSSPTYSVAVGDTNIVNQRAVAVTVSLPTVASNSGRVLQFINESSFPETLLPAGSDKIDSGSTSFVIPASNQSITIYCDGTQWMVSGNRSISYSTILAGPQTWIPLQGLQSARAVAVDIGMDDLLLGIVEVREYFPRYVPDVVSVFQAVGSQTSGVAFDGTNLISCDQNTDRIFVYSGISAIVINSFAAPGVGHNTRGLVVATGNLISGDSGTGKVYVHSGISSIITNSFASSDTDGLAFDGTNLISNANGARIFVHSGISATIKDSFASPGGSIRGLGFNGVNLFSTDATTLRTYTHSGISAIIINSFSSPGADATRIVFSGTTLISLGFATNRFYVHRNYVRHRFNDNYQTRGSQRWMTSIKDRIEVRIVGVPGLIITNSFSSPATAPQGLTFDGANLISCDSAALRIYVHSGISSIITNSFSSPATAPQGLVFDGVNLISCDSAGTGSIYVHSGVSSIVVNSFSSPATTPQGLAFDGVNLISDDSTAHRIYVHSGQSIGNVYAAIHGA